MAIYLAERHLPGITVEELTTFQEKAIEISERFMTEGKPVRYLRSVFVPSEAYCLSLFESDSAILVRDLNEAAQIPFTRIIEAIDISP